MCTTSTVAELLQHAGESSNKVIESNLLSHVARPLLAPPSKFATSCPTRPVPNPNRASAEKHLRWRCRRTLHTRTAPRRSSLASSDPKRSGARQGQNPAMEPSEPSEEAGHARSSEILETYLEADVPTKGPLPGRLSPFQSNIGYIRRTAKPFHFPFGPSNKIKEELKTTVMH